MVNWCYWLRSRDSSLGVCCSFRVSDQCGSWSGDGCGRCWFHWLWSLIAFEGMKKTTAQMLILLTWRKKKIPVMNSLERWALGWLSLQTNRISPCHRLCASNSGHHHWSCLDCSNSSQGFGISLCLSSSNKESERSLV